MRINFIQLEVIKMKDWSTVSTVIEEWDVMHAKLIRQCANLNDEQLQFRPVSSCNNIAWIIWHLGRWSDIVASTYLPQATGELEKVFGERSQIWHREKIAERWGWQAETLGELESGWRMESEVARSLLWPEADDLRDYLQRTFQELKAACALVPEDQLGEIDQRRLRTKGETRTVGRMLIILLTHYDLHSGQVRILRKIQGLEALPSPAQ